MSYFRRLLSSFDRKQRSAPTVGLVYAVVKKFGDDKANQYVVALGWYGFVAIYPLVLAVVTILGFIGAPSLGHRFVSTLHEFPVVGPQFNPEHPSKSLEGSGIGLAVGLLGLIYGAQGVTQTVQRAMAGVWNVADVDTPTFFPRLIRSLIALIVIGGSFVVDAAFATLVTHTGADLVARAWALFAMVIFNLACYLVVFHVTTPVTVPWSNHLPGAALASVGFTLLITLGAGLVQHQLRHSSETYGQFGLVIGLVGFLFLLAKISLYGAELNPVISRHLWPRGLQEEDPTAADFRVLSDLAQQARRRKDQRIYVSFGEDPADQAGTDAASSS
jgi:uncharacterized BrkB/YihY/UPF0761 family membrane protein